MRVLAFLAFVGLVSAGVEKWTNMRVKYGPVWLGNNIFFLWTVPRTLSQALSGRWQNVTIENGLNVQFVGVSQQDIGFNPFYDSHGFLSGAHFCQPTSIVATGPPTYNPLLSGTNELKTIDGSEFICSHFLIIDPVSLKTGGRDFMDNFGEGLWVLDTTDRVTGYKQIPVDADVLMQETHFTQQNCFSAMGKHYFDNFTTDFNCDNFNSWFLLGQENDITGIGWQIFGQKTVFDYDWYDFLPRIAAELIAPKVHECLYEWIDEYEIVSAHVFFTDDPWSISCSDGDSVETKDQQNMRLEKLRHGQVNV